MDDVQAADDPTLGGRNELSPCEGREEAQDAGAATAARDFVPISDSMPAPSDPAASDAPPAPDAASAPAAREAPAASPALSAAPGPPPPPAREGGRGGEVTSGPGGAVVPELSSDPVPSP